MTSNDVPPASSPPSEDVQRMLAALQRSAARARRVAAQTGTRLIVVRDGELVAEPVSPADLPTPPGPPPDHPAPSPNRSS
ncbi:hypothetical protein RQM47_12395 [Rubrivirga sp. S365]|uniref:Uncharacterized protein n=1 Tax=Rubrivirga litoralis TaxID=3075598 RepID=A0ABU3BVE0_9BACT|nr:MULTISPECIES: hypothetical protein [unclassified Rubrivirga]MDT0633253.1 hypothetical protein [Rubrivirga sp. F394]MDT7857444.1 hypothetical protein [Rubrivirga sp. S365]